MKIVYRIKDIMFCLFIGIFTFIVALLTYPLVILYGFCHIVEFFYTNRITKGYIVKFNEIMTK